LKEFVKLNIEKVIALPNGYSNSVFKPLNVYNCRVELGLPLDKKILLNIGNLEDYKGQIYLINAMEKILKKNDDILLYIIGRGSLRSKLESRIKALNLTENIFLVGSNKPMEEIPKWFNACDVFVLPSLSEGNPTVMFEALGCGKPFVGTDVGGIPEIIVNDNLGFLVKPRNANSLSKAIQKALEKTWDIEYILNYAKQFTWKAIVDQMIKIYKKL